MSASSFTVSNALVVLLAAIAASLSYQTIELNNALETVQSDVRKCKSLNPSGPPTLARVPADGHTLQPAQGTAGQSADPTGKDPYVAPDMAAHPFKAVPTASQYAASPMLMSLQDAFQHKSALDTSPISTVSPLGTGDWGAAKP